MLLFDMFNKCSSCSCLDGEFPDELSFARGIYFQKAHTIFVHGMLSNICVCSKKGGGTANLIFMSVGLCECVLVFVNV